MRVATLLTAALLVADPGHAQDPPPPPGMAAVEVERSRECVAILQQVEALDAELAPLAQRGQRLVTIADAVALEDERVMGQLDTTDPIESQVHEWFVQDQELAQRYAATLSNDIVTRRATLRAGIEDVLTQALQAVQDEADTKIEASGDLGAQAGRCDGAIFVRPVVLEACQTGSGALCDAAALPTDSASRQFRFVDTPESVWDVQELRPWSAPGPLRASQTGQLDGARTVGYARAGNLVLSVAFSPLLRDRDGLLAEDAQRLQAVNDSLGIRSTHPEVMFTPALGIRANLSRPLAGESSYVLHFGPPEEADVIWAGAAGSGEPIQQTIAFGASHVGRLQSGEPIALTALRELGPDENEAVFTIELTSVNQTNASGALLGYMVNQLDQDLARLLQPGD